MHIDVNLWQKRQHIYWKTFLLCQVYQANTGHYICHNKYYGRRLSSDGVEESLYEFLHNGYRLRVDLVELIIERLRKLYTMVAKQNKFRFYSSSLLIMYDGGQGDIGSPTSEEPMDNCPGQAMASDHDMVLTKVVSEQCNNVASHDNTNSWRAYQKPHKCIRDKGYKNSKSTVDVRMIDFAHATHHGFRGDQTLHTGPDNGYLFGLENIIRMLESLKVQDSHQS